MNDKVKLTAGTGPTFPPDDFRDLKPGEWVRLRDDLGNEADYEVKYAPWQLGHGEWVVGVNGITGGYALSRVVGRVSPTVCAVCDWPLAADAKSGCVPGNCCYRPDPGSDEGRKIAQRRAELAAGADSAPPRGGKTDAEKVRLACLPGEDRCVVGDPGHVCGLLADEVNRLAGKLARAERQDAAARCHAKLTAAGIPDGNDETGWPGLDERVMGVVAERDKLAKFKAWVHEYLDTHGVPFHPPGTHGAEGCRIGDRMDWLMARPTAAEADRDKYRAALDIIAQVRAVTGSAQGAFRSNLKIADAALAGADLRDADTVEAVVCGRWKPAAPAAGATRGE